jgi:hypothetical protein
MLDDSVNELLVEDNCELERELLADTTSAPVRVGTGLALGVFRRARRKRERQGMQSLEGERAPLLVRQRNDSPML